MTTILNYLVYKTQKYFGKNKLDALLFVGVFGSLIGGFAGSVVTNNSDYMIIGAFLGAGFALAPLWAVHAKELWCDYLKWKTSEEQRKSRVKST